LLREIISRAGGLAARANKTRRGGKNGYIVFGLDRYTRQNIIGAPTFGIQQARISPKKREREAEKNIKKRGGTQ